MPASLGAGGRPSLSTNQLLKVATALDDTAYGLKWRGEPLHPAPNRAAPWPHGTLMRHATGADSGSGLMDVRPAWCGRVGTLQSPAQVGGPEPRTGRRARLPYHYFITPPNATYLLIPPLLFSLAQSTASRRTATFK